MAGAEVTEVSTTSSFLELLAVVTKETQEPKGRLPNVTMTSRMDNNVLGLLAPVETPGQTELPMFRADLS